MPRDIHFRAKTAGGLGTLLFLLAFALIVRSIDQIMPAGDEYPSPYRLHGWVNPETLS